MMLHILLGDYKFSEMVDGAPLARIEYHSMNEFRDSIHWDELLNILFFEESLLSKFKLIIALDFFTTTSTFSETAAIKAATEILEN